MSILLATHPEGLYHLVQSKTPPDSYTYLFHYQALIDTAIVGKMLDPSSISYSLPLRAPKGFLSALFYSHGDATPERTLPG